VAAVARDHCDGCLYRLRSREVCRHVPCAREEVGVLVVPIFFEYVILMIDELEV